MATIEQLEREINQKTLALNERLRVQFVLRETLKSSTAAMEQVEKQLKEIAVYLKDTNDAIYRLKQENRNLKLSSDKWMRRAIQLEFKVLSAADATKNRQ